LRNNLEEHISQMITNFSEKHVASVPKVLHFKVPYSS